MNYRFYPYRDKQIVELCRTKKVLHIGACDWPCTQEKLDRGNLLYQRIDHVCDEQLGIDLDQKSIDLLKKQGYVNSKIMRHDMNDVLGLDFIPDIVIFGETIEHLINIGTAFSNLKQVMTKQTRMIISTPNAYAINNFLNAFFGKEYQHPDHSVLFSRQVLMQMCEKNNMQVVSADYSVLDSYLGRRLNTKGKIMSWISRKVGYLFPMLAPTLLFVVEKECD